MMYFPSSGRRGYEYYGNRRNNKPSSWTSRIRNILKRKYGLSVMNTMLLCALIFSWIYIAAMTFYGKSDKLLLSNNTIPVSNNNNPKPIQNQHHASHMKELVEKYQQLKWMDAHDKNNKHPIPIFNESFYDHKSGNSLFDIWSDTELKNNDICPAQFPDRPPKFEDMKYVCSHLHWFKFGGYCDDTNCSDCIPPNSKVPGSEWHNTDTIPWIQQYESTLVERRKNITKLLHSNGFVNKNDGPIIVLTLNHGYSFLFYNWVCSLDYNKISLIKNRTIIIPTQLETIPLIKKAGFKMIFYPYWLGKVLNRIDGNMPKTFALGAHRWVVSLQIAIISDLIELGYDVITQDSDIIYIKNPLYYLLQDRFKNVDIQMMVDERHDRRGPGNSGFYIVRSNCKTKVFMQTMIKLIGAVLVARSDQILWNTLINEKLFRMVTFQTLSQDYFVGGNQINIAYETKREDLPNDTMLIHACWTTDQFDKIEKFWNVEHYYFTKERCPHLWEYEMMPDLKDKKWHIRAKTQEQEAKLLKLGLVRDTSNGHYTTPEPKNE